MAVGPIPWTAMRDWCEFNRIDEEAARILIRVLRTLDIEQAEARRAEADVKEALGRGRDQNRRYRR